MSRDTAMQFLPTTFSEMRERGWSQPDFVYVTGVVLPNQVYQKLSKLHMLC